MNLKKKHINGKHCTMAAVCKVRREYVKEKGKELRAKSRSRSQMRSNVTYAQAVEGVGSEAQIQTTVIQFIENEIKAIITKIIASITYRHYRESLQEGTFQSIADEMFRLKTLPRG